MSHTKKQINYGAIERWSILICMSLGVLAGVAACIGVSILLISTGNPGGFVNVFPGIIGYAFAGAGVGALIGVGVGKVICTIVDLGMQIAKFSVIAIESAVENISVFSKSLLSSIWSFFVRTEPVPTTAQSSNATDSSVIAIQFDDDAQEPYFTPSTSFFDDNRRDSIDNTSVATPVAELTTNTL